MYKISDSEALYLQDISLSNYPANSQRIIRSSVDYFCRWADAHVETREVLTTDYLNSLVDRYHSHLVTLHIPQSGIASRLKYAKLFVLWLQSLISSQAKRPISSSSLTRVSTDNTFWGIKNHYYLIISLFLCLFLCVFYLIVSKSLRNGSTREKYYVIDSTRSIRVQLSPSSTALSLSSLSSSSFEFRFIRDVNNLDPLFVYCPVPYMGMEPDISIITIPLSSCFSKNTDASNKLIHFSGYADVYVDGQFVTRRIIH